MVYQLVARSCGMRVIVAPSNDWTTDLPRMAAAITADTKLVCFANPNNPTGTYVPLAQLSSFMAQIPDHVLVVVDEAFIVNMPLLRQIMTVPLVCWLTTTI